MNNNTNNNIDNNDNNDIDKNDINDINKNDILMSINKFNDIDLTAKFLIEIALGYKFFSCSKNTQLFTLSCKSQSSIYNIQLSVYFVINDNPEFIQQQLIAKFIDLDNKYFNGNLLNDDYHTVQNNVATTILAKSNQKLIGNKINNTKISVRRINNISNITKNNPCRFTIYLLSNDDIAIPNYFKLFYI